MSYLIALGDDINGMARVCRPPRGADSELACQLGSFFISCQVPPSWISECHGAHSDSKGCGQCSEGQVDSGLMVAYIGNLSNTPSLKLTMILGNQLHEAIVT